MDVKKNNLFYFLTYFVIGCGILFITYAQEPNYQLPTGNTYAISEVRTVEAREIDVRKSEEEPRTNPIVNKQPIIVSNSGNGQSEENSQEPVQSVLRHNGYAENDYRQDIVNYAYQLGGMDLVTLMECESGMNPKANGDSGHARGLCQMNDTYHTVSDDYKNNWKTQVETCAEKRKGGTKFYGPQRYINGMQCSKYVLSRFTFL